MKKLLRFMTVTGMMIVSSWAYALGVGEIESSSSLGEPLVARIGLTIGPNDQVSSIKVKLAPIELYEKEGIEYQPLLRNLKFDVKGTADNSYIEVTSSVPVREPFLSFLIETSWSQGKVIREFTLLLDPPSLMPVTEAPDTQVPVVIEPVIQTAPVVTSRLQDTVAISEPTSSTSAGGGLKYPVSGQYDAGASTYGPIRRNETLYQIASRLRPDASISVNQMMIAIYQKNPQAFGKTINFIKQGSILKVPDLTEIRAISSAEANKSVSRQYSEWQASKAARANGQSGSSQARLELVVPSFDEGADIGSSGEGTGSGSNNGDGESDASREEVLALQAKVKELNQLLALKNTELAAIQNQLREANKDTAPDEDQVEALLEAATDIAADLSGKATDAAGNLAEMGSKTLGKVSEMGGDAIESVSELTDNLSETMPSDEDAVLEEKVGAEKEVEAIKEIQEALPESESLATLDTDSITPEVLIEQATSEKDSLEAWLAPVDQFLSSYLPESAMNVLRGSSSVFVVALLLPVLLLLAAIFWLLGLKKNTEVIPDSVEPKAVSRPAGSQVIAESDDAKTDLQDVQASTADRVNDTEVDQDLEDTSSGTLASALNETDPISEADLHMAYGMPDEALRIITEGIEQYPENREFLLKRQEILFDQADSEMFVKHAQIMSEQGTADSAWEKVMIMGRQLLPGTALFADQSPSDEVIEMPDEDDVPDSVEDILVDLDDGPESMSETMINKTHGGTIDLGGTEGVEQALAEIENANDQSEGVDPLATFEVESGALDIDELISGDSDTDTNDIDLSDEGTDEIDLDAALADLAVTDDVEPEEGVTEISEEAVADAGMEFDLSDLAVPDAGTDVTEESDLVSDTASSEEDGSLDFELGEELEVSAEGMKGEESEDLAPEEAVVDTIAAEDELEGLAPLDDYSELVISDETMVQTDVVETKLDLARAYLEMDDADGAKSLLEEVISEGSDTQRKSAEELMGSIG